MDGHDERAILTVNGAPEPFAGQDLARLLAARGVDARAFGVAVALNGRVVPRRRWAAVRLAPGDRVEIVSVKGGG